MKIIISLLIYVAFISLSACGSQKSVEANIVLPGVVDRVKVIRENYGATSDYVFSFRLIPDGKSGKDGTEIINIEGGRCLSYRAEKGKLVVTYHSSSYITNFNSRFIGRNSDGRPQEFEVILHRVNTCLEGNQRERR